MQRHTTSIYTLVAKSDVQLKIKSYSVCQEHFISLQCICKINRHRHFSVRVCPPIPQTCLEACKIGNLALILRNPHHENLRFSESEGMG